MRGDQLLKQFYKMEEIAHNYTGKLVNDLKRSRTTVSKVTIGNHWYH